MTCNHVACLLSSSMSVLHVLSGRRGLSEPAVLGDCCLHVCCSLHVRQECHKQGDGYEKHRKETECICVCVCVCTYRPNYVFWVDRLDSGRPPLGELSLLGQINEMLGSGVSDLCVCVCMCDMHCVLWTLCCACGVNSRLCVVPHAHAVAAHVLKAWDQE